MRKLDRRVTPDRDAGREAILDRGLRRADAGGAVLFIVVFFKVDRADYPMADFAGREGSLNENERVFVFRKNSRIDIALHRFVDLFDL